MTATLKRAFLTAPDSFGEMQSGIVYFEGDKPSAVFDEHLHIHKGENDLWHLTIENCQWESRDVAELEAHLRAWADGEYPDFPEPSTHADIMVELLARAFSAQLAEDIGAENLQRVIEINAATGEPCASHEFCDANMVMDAAWQKLGLAPMPFAEDGGPSDEQINLWNRAWDMAVSARFFTVPK